MVTVLLFILWIIFALLGASSTQTHNLGLFMICAPFTVILTIILILRVFHSLGNSSESKRKYREVNFEEKEEYFRDSTTEHITLNHPEYIGLLTKIDKKRIAEEYLASLKKDQKHGKDN